jgi:hypothetical protein
MKNGFLLYLVMMEALVFGQEIPCGDEKIVIAKPNVGEIIAAVGEGFAGPIGSRKICHGQAVLQSGGAVNWGDKQESAASVADPFYLGILHSSHTYLQGGTFTVAARYQALCYYPNQTPHGVTERSCGTAVARVYENIPLKSVTLSATSVKGGGRVTATVFLVEKSKGLGTLIKPTATSPAFTVPYVIVTKDLDTVTFDVDTVAVSTPITVPLSVYSGGTTQLVSLTVTLKLLNFSQRHLRIASLYWASSC